MELGVRSPPLRSPTPPATTLSPPGSRLAKLPPIGPGTGGDERAGDVHVTPAIMQTACTELKDSMGHLLNEAQSAEARIKIAIESMWQKMNEMLGQKVREYEKEITDCRAELATTREQLSRAQAQEASLVHQNARMSMELVAAEKREKNLESRVSELEKKLSSEVIGFSRAEEGWNCQKVKDKKELEGVQKELNEKSKVLQEYQDKLSKLTEKVQKLTKGLATEKAAAEKLQKSASDRSTHHTTENRKLALEISKLKAQLSASNGVVSAGKEEVKKLTQQLQSQQQRSDESMERLRLQHRETVQRMENTIAALEDDIQKLKEQHKNEIDELLTKLQKALAHEVDDYLEARIKFLRHQNQKEKIKILRDTKSKQ